MIRDYSRLSATVFRREQVSGLTALVVGAGALGNEVLKNLALMGVGTLTIVDRDHVERSNLTRSILFCIPEIEEHLARRAPKAELAARRVQEINPDVKAEPVTGEFADLGLGRIRRADLIFSCVDNEMARLETGWACSRLNKLLVDGGLGLINYSSGLVSLFPGAEGPCYACRKGSEGRRRLLGELYGREDPCWLKEQLLREDSVVSTTPLMSSVVAAFQVEIGLRRRLGEADAEPDKGQAFEITMAPRTRLQKFEFKRSPNCPLHEKESRIDEVLERPEFRSDQATPADLFAAFEGSCCLCLDWPITAAARCLACGRRWHPLVRRARFRGQRCPQCESPDLRETEVLTEITPDCVWARRTFSELGLPRCHIHELAMGNRAGAERIHVEITGDWSSESEKGEA